MAFALNQILVGVTNGAAMTDTLMRCGAGDNFRQTLNATEFMTSRLWLSNKTFNSREFLGQSNYATSIRNTEFINKLENGENGVIALNAAINEMLPEDHKGKRRMSYSYLNQLICASEMIVNPRMWNDHCAKIWHVKFSDIIEATPKVNRERAVFQAGFYVDRNPSVCSPIANMFGTQYVVGCGVIERPFHHLAPPLGGENGAELSVSTGSKDFVFGVNSLKMDYPTNSPTNDVVIFGIDTRFQNRTAADILHHNDVDTDNVEDLQARMMKSFSEEQEILTINGVFQNMFSTTIKAISMGGLIKEKEVLLHYYMALVDNDVKVVQAPSSVCNDTTDIQIFEGTLKIQT